VSPRSLILAAVLLHAVAAAPPPARTITWQEAAPAHGRLGAAGITPQSFPAFIDRIARTNARRVREGDLDHLVFYLLQSTTFTKLPPIEPALSARTFAGTGEVPLDVRARVRALLSAVRSGGGDARLSYFRAIVRALLPAGNAAEGALLQEYGRAMKFLYEKEFVAQKSDRRAADIAELYRTRGLSTDTAVEAGFLVREGLAVLHAVAPEFRVRRVLIVGPGLDLAPRTGLIDARPPESYQPWTVIDALLSIGLARSDDLQVVCADINPRVVEHIRRAAAKPPRLTFAPEIQETATVSLTADFRAYVADLGKAIGNPVQPSIARAVTAERLDIVTQRLAARDFDLAIATNILPYFDDMELLLALSNIAAMLAPRGVFLHNEPRPAMEEVSRTVGLTLEQARTAIVANVRGAPPLVDSVFVHRKPGG
jgi:hypothetical protein